MCLLFYLWILFADKSKYEALEFTDVCEYHLGKTGKYSSVCFSLIALLGATTVYLVLLSNFLYNVGTFIYGKYVLFLFLSRLVAFRLYDIHLTLFGNCVTCYDEC